MPPRSFAPLLVLLSVLLAGPAAAAVPAVPSGGAGQPTVTAADPASTTTLPDNGTLGEPNTTMRIQLQSNGDARWEVAYAFPLGDGNTTETFEELAARFERGETALAGPDAFEMAATEASAATGRSMELTDDSRSHTVENGTGTLVLSFTWTDFARTSGDRLIVGDAFSTRDGTWLDELSARQTLEIAPPAGYDVYSSPVAVDGGIARWEGPHVFGANEPGVTYTGDVTPTTPTTGPATTTVPPTTNGTTPGASSSSLPFGPLAVLAGAGVTAFAAYRYRDDLGSVSGLLPGSGPDDGAGAAAAEPADAATDEGSAAAAAVAAEEAAGPTEDGDGTSDDPVDPELLSDEERVERLLERNGGRMKQANIVKETGWSNAKVSQLLSSMADEGRIDKLRIGRENLISFPDEDVTDVESD